MKQIKNKNEHVFLTKKAGFSLVWIHLYIMTCMIFILITAPLFGFITSSITFMLFGTFGVLKIIRINNKTKIKVTNKYESMVKRYSDIKNRCNQTSEIVDKKIEIQDEAKPSVTYIDNIKIFSLQHSI